MTAAGAASRWPLVGVLLLGIFSGAAINNIAAAPLSVIAQDFGTSPASITLVASASGFALACCMPVAGWMSVRWGTRRTLVPAFALLMVSCLLAGLAQSLWLLAGARVLQGMAMSVVPPTVMHALPAIAGAQQRERALGWWAVANGAGTASGAPLGAVIADAFGWRAIFLVFVPPLVLLVVGCLWLQQDAEPHGPLDVPGAVLVTAALAFLIAPALTAGMGVSAAVLVGIVVAGTTATVLFLRRISRTKLPLVTPRFLRTDGFLVGTLGGTCQMFTLGSISVLVPLILLAERISLRLAGVFVLLVTLVMMLSAPPISALALRFGAGRIIMMGLWLATAGIFATAWFLGHGHVGPAVVSLLALGIALGCLQSPSAIVVSSEKSSRGSGVGIYNSLRFAAGVLGVSWLSLMAGLGMGATRALLAALVPIGAAGIVVTIHQVSRKAT